MKKTKITKSAELFNIIRLTTSFGRCENIKPNILPDRALKRLSEYENTGLTPTEILQLKETILNLQKRIERLEGWN